MNAHLVLIALAVASWMVNPPADRNLAIACSAIASLCFIGLELGSPRLRLSSAPSPEAVAVMVHFNRIGLWALLMVFAVWIYRESLRAEQTIEVERKRADDLLRNILPAAVAERLKHTPGPIAERHDSGTVLFADIANFTQLAERDCT